jgi:enterochelin esterase-like enzyme
MGLSFKLIIISLFFSFNVKCQYNGAILFDSINSIILNQVSRYAVYLPPSFSAESIIKYPVIYLLHGFNGNEKDWIRKGKINRIMDSLVNNKIISDFLLIMPAAKNSYYINNYNKSYRYEDYFIQEFVPYVENKYSNYILDSARIIAGLSMGGFGAAIFSIKYPNKFNMCITLSSAVRPPNIFSKLSESRYKLLFSEVFDTSLTGNHRITEHWKNNSPFYLINNINADKLKNIHWYIDCGLDDSLLPSNQAFHQLLLKYKIEHNYIEREGNHNWDYWSTGITKALIYLNNIK